MSRTATVAEYVAYLREPWPHGTWVDDSLIQVEHDGSMRELSDEDDMDADGLERTFDPSAKVKIIAGVIYRENDSSYEVSYARHFAAWRKARTSETLVITFPKEAGAYVREMLAGVEGLKIAGPASR